MGTLTDITGNASNVSKRTSAASTASQALSSVAAGENLGKKPLHYMSPTVSSTKQTASRPSSLSNRALTPSAPASKQVGSGNWMASAAKRVGFSRVGDGIPRSKKEGLGKQSKGVIFPDKVGCFFSLSMPSLSKPCIFALAFDALEG